MSDRGSPSLQNRDADEHDDPTIRGAQSPRLGPEAPSAALALDVIERIFVVALYLWLVQRIVHHRVAGDLASLLILPSEGLVVFFMVIRRRTDSVSRRPLEWALAVAATTAPMLVTTGIGRGALLPVEVAATVLVMGMLIQVHAKVVLGRSFGCVPAHRGLKLAGPYRFVRHPMYAGYLLSHLAYLAMNPIAWNLAMYAAAYALQIPRLLAEERILANDPAYREYQARVRYRLLPGVF